jgi:hypothetical protein
MSRVECSIPLRNFLGTKNGLDIARSCGSIRIAWTLGVCLILTLALIITHYVLEKQKEDGNKTLTIPLWAAAIPSAYAAFVYFTAVESAERYWKTEELMFNTSDMPKKEFLNYRVADDRLVRSSETSLLGTTFIGSTALFGPFLRGDNR